MRAVTVMSYGAPDAVEVSEVPTPEPGPGEVRVRVSAAAVNPVDPLTAAGVLAPLLPPGVQPPLHLGWDVAGVVDAVGADAGRWSVGDAVIAMSPWFESLAGTHADHVVLRADLLAAAPRSVDAVAAATLPLNALTAAQALDLLDVASGGTILVTGAAGAVGGYAVQLAASRGLTVVGSGSGADEAAIRGFGAKEFVQRSDAFAEAVRAGHPDGVDGVLDAAPVGAAALPAVRDGGAFVTVLDATRPEPERGVRVDKVSVTGDGRRLADLVDLLDQGVLTARVAGTLPLEQAGVAYARVLGGGQRGRWVLVP